jgi:hypothetical protein
MTFRQLSIGDNFRFPAYDDPYHGKRNQGDIWRKVSHGFYVNVKTPRKRDAIDDPNRSVYKEEKVGAH